MLSNVQFWANTSNCIVFHGFGCLVEIALILLYSKKKNSEYYWHCCKICFCPLAFVAVHPWKKYFRKKRKIKDWEFYNVASRYELESSAILSFQSNSIQWNTNHYLKSLSTSFLIQMKCFKILKSWKSRLFRLLRLKFFIFFLFCRNFFSENHIKLG